MMLDPAVRQDEFWAQQPDEFRQMTQHIPWNAKAILEIGSRYGETLKRLAYCCPLGARIVAVDLGQDPHTKGIDTLGYLRRAVDSLIGYDVHLILGDSHDPKTIESVRKLGPYDFGFIDGEHTPGAVIQDYEAYGPMCKVIAFHDVKMGCVKPAWDKISEGRKHVRYLSATQPNQHMGIGVLLEQT